MKVRIVERQYMVKFFDKVCSVFPSDNALVVRFCTCSQSTIKTNGFQGNCVACNTTKSSNNGVHAHTAKLHFPVLFAHSFPRLGSHFRSLHAVYSPLDDKV